MKEKIIEPKLYEINEDVTEEQLAKNGFLNLPSYYKYSRTLYKNTIFLQIIVDKSDMTMTIKVSDINDGGIYSPFYNPDDRHNNLVYLDVVNTYNYFMDKLVNKNILKYVDEIKIIKGEERIKIKYHSDEIEKIKMTDIGDWIDLRAAEDVVLKKGEFKLIPLGVAMQLPKGYEAIIVPRSSTYKNFGIIQTNHIGIIDESYCGDNDQWLMPVLAMRDTKIKINDRICQFRILKHQPQIEFEEVKELYNADRGGIGSTGKQ